ESPCLRVIYKIHKWTSSANCQVNEFSNVPTAAGTLRIEIVPRRTVTFQVSLMASKGKSKRKGSAVVPSAPTPLSLYKRGLSAVRSWTPLNSARADAEALIALASSVQMLQARMGYTLLQQQQQQPPATQSITTNTTTATAGTAVATGCVPSGQAVEIANGSSSSQQHDEHHHHHHHHLEGEERLSPFVEWSSQEPSGRAKECGNRAAGQMNGASRSGGDDTSQHDRPDPLLVVWMALEALAPGMASYSAKVRHSLDLDLEDWQDEPGFLLASCHLEIGKLLGRMFPRREVAEQRHLEAALVLFPDFVAAGLALGQALMARADHPDQLVEGEVRLKTALAAAEALTSGSGRDAAEDGLLLDANAACRGEWEAGAAARRSLAMLLCQEGRDQEAVPHLKALDFTHRLARQVLHYPLDVLLVDREDSDAPTVAAAAAAASDDDGEMETPVRATLSDARNQYPRYLRAVDDALPPSLLHLLRTALAPGARFWAEHGYGRVGYFSYMHELGSPCLSAIHQATVLVHRLIMTRYPAVTEARFAEWWAHCRRHPSGHQLHFDSDDEGVGGVRNPIVSGVVYLTGGVGGPTLVTPQLLGGPLAPHGWLVHPRENRLGMFDSTVLHGVIPGRGPSPRPGDYRITLMIAFWRDIQCRSRDDGLPGPSQPYPAPGSPAASRYSWMADLPAHPDGPDGWGTTDPRDAAPMAIDRVWERLDGVAAQPGAVPYDACFQGF
ncbi:hypothetical protein VaNZ11_012559, partial [Volvox africanus]